MRPGKKTGGDFPARWNASRVTREEKDLNLLAHRADAPVAGLALWIEKRPLLLATLTVFPLTLVLGEYRISHATTVRCRWTALHR